MKKMVARKIPSNRYGTVIEVNTPIRFYWDKEGKFDGVDVTVPKGTSSYQKRLLLETIGISQIMVEMFDDINREMDEERTPMPRSILKAFGEDDELKPA
jgi:hypothetical protein